MPEKTRADHGEEHAEVARCGDRPALRREAHAPLSSRERAPQLFSPPPRRHFPPARTPLGSRARGQRHQARLHRAHRRLALIIAKEKKLFDKYGLPEMEILKQASWGATRDNMALGTKANGIDGAHLLRPKVHLTRPARSRRTTSRCRCSRSSTSTRTARAISVSNEYKDLAVGTASGAEGSLRQEEGRRQGGEGRHDLPRRHA